MEKTHLHEEKTTWYKTQKSLLDDQQKFQIIPQQLLLYKAILKPVWTYGIQLWGSTANSNLEILERFQSKVLQIIVNAPWFVPNRIITHDLKIKTAKSEIRDY
jgi:hypothetical protein